MTQRNSGPLLSSARWQKYWHSSSTMIIHLVLELALHAAVATRHKALHRHGTPAFVELALAASMHCC